MDNYTEGIGETETKKFAESVSYYNQLAGFSGVTRQGPSIKNCRGLVFRFNRLHRLHPSGSCVSSSEKCDSPRLHTKSRSSHSLNRDW